MTTCLRSHHTGAHPPVKVARQLPRRAWTLLAGATSVLMLLVIAQGTLAEEAAGGDVTMIVEPMLAGHVRPGDWAAVRVHLENNGPTVDGELRIASAEEGASRYGISVQLAPGARQDHVLYGQAGFFGSRFSITLVSGDTIVATGQAPFDGADPGQLGVYVVAERPERLMGDLRASLTSRGVLPPVLVALSPQDLPPRAEAWSMVDRLVWQDVPITDLGADQLEALRTWVAVGGHLVILGGSTGTTALDTFPDDLLPYRPERVIDIPVADLQALLGTVPAGATPVPALAGPLQRGTAFASSGGDTFAARVSHGHGSVSIIGIDPATSWLAGTPAAAAVWGRAVPSGSAGPDAFSTTDDSFLVDALTRLPSVELPRMDHLVVLFLGYALLLGPVNYVVLRRFDRREWAWFTMPALIAVFTITAFALGVVLRGTSVVVNELAIVRGAAGTDRGLADVYVGVFSPNRAAFDVRIGGGALASEPIVDQHDPTRRPLDVLLGDPSRLRGFAVGFGSLRAFRAETAVTTPRIDADLELAGDRLHGEVTNGSGVALDHVSIVYGDAVQVLGGMAPGETRAIDVSATGPAGAGSLDRRLFGRSDSDGIASRSLASRRAVIRYLTGGWWDPESGSTDVLSSSGPVILAWRSGATLDIDVGTAADRVGETLYLLPVRPQVSGPITFAGSALAHALLEVDAVEGWEEPFGLYLDRGTMTVDYRPTALEGSFEVTSLSLRLGSARATPGVAGDDLVPLPASEQPDQEEPAGSDVPEPFGGQLPAMQLFDRVGGVWVEFEALIESRTYRVVDPAQYVDASGAFRVRFVERDTTGGVTFWLGARLEGTVQ